MHPLYSFGPFSFDVASGELARGGETQRLTPQTAAVLQLLLEANGGVVSRAELQRRVWPDSTVEFDQGINFCVRQLRIALGDDAAQPTYIETLPRRGYRLLVPVAPGDAPASPTRARFARPMSVITIGVVLLALGAWGLSVSARDRSVRLAIVPFDADSGLAPLVDYRNRLADELVERITNATKKQVAVLGPASTSAWNALSAPDTIRSHLGADYIVSGIVRRRGPSFDVFVQFIRTSDGAHVWVARPTDSSFGRTGRLQDAERIADSISMLLTSGEAARRPPRANRRTTNRSGGTTK